MAKPFVVFVDVDDTLVHHAGSKQIPMPGTINHVRALHEAGAVLYCWSTGGAKYAQEIAESLGLGDCFADYLPKPDVILDDEAVADWRQCVEVTPSEASGRLPSDYTGLVEGSGA